MHIFYTELAIACILGFLGILGNVYQWNVAKLLIGGFCISATLAGYEWLKRQGYRLRTRLPTSFLFLMGLFLASYSLMTYFGVETLSPLGMPGNIGHIEPVVELAVGNPFDNLMAVTVRNSGIEAISNVSANLRCFVLESPDDPNPVLFFEGYPSISHGTSWWQVDALDPGRIVTKDAKESADRCLYNAKLGSQGAHSHILFAVDLSFSRSSDHKLFERSGIANLLLDANTQQAFLWPLAITSYHRRILDTITPPTFVVKP